MSREKSIFEQMGGTYTEKDGILYPKDIVLWYFQTAPTQMFTNIIRIYKLNVNRKI